MLWDAAGELIQKDQSLTVGLTAAEVEKTKFMQQALPVFAQLQEVEARVGPGTVSRESLDRLESLLEQAKALLLRCLAGTAPIEQWSPCAELAARG